VHSLSQLTRNLLKLRLHAIAARATLEEKSPSKRLAGNEGKAQKAEGLRFFRARAACDWPPRGVQTQSGESSPDARTVKRPQAFTHRIPEASSVVLVFKANDHIVSVAHDNHVARGLAPSPALSPEIEAVVQVDISQQW